MAKMDETELFYVFIRFIFLLSKTLSIVHALITFANFFCLRLFQSFFVVCLFRCLLCETENICHIDAITHSTHPIIISITNISYA